MRLSVTISNGEAAKFEANPGGIVRAKTPLH